ncbi:MAG: protein-methionine-sulfoxide reductase catalytic subunit MsrP [Pseudohongiellaceae bacterium]
MLIKKPDDIKPSEITPEAIYRNRRQFMKDSSTLLLGGSLAGAALPAFAQDGDALKARAPGNLQRTPPASWWQGKFEDITPAPDEEPRYTNEALTPFNDVTTFNNFYEFGMDKSDPSSYSSRFRTDPWSVEISGECDKPGVYALEDIVQPHKLEERIYRMRCVEAWSMVIPWIGIPLAAMLKHFEPNSNAKYVEFETVVQRDTMPGVRSRLAIIDWPYREGLRMDEAMNELAFMAVGLYGTHLPAQNGAPMRLVVPWKYGFKGIKSIVRINFRRTEPNTTWNDLAANEYGFYANVNPQVHHPRWRQDRERRLPYKLLGSRYINTRLFNGYTEQVAHLYSGMDLARYY